MAPSELRALSARVLAGEATNEEIALVLGWHQAEGNSNIWELPGSGRWQLGCPAFLTSLDAAGLPWLGLRGRGWLISVWQQTTGEWSATGWVPEVTPRLRGAWAMASKPAPTEPQARVALALLCWAAEMEREGARA